MDKKYSFADLIEIVEILRSDRGCPWDRVQTHGSLKVCMLEEAYEVIEGIRILEQSGAAENLREELGDVLLQVVMHAQIAAEEQHFIIADVIQEICEKMIRRHPHVFGSQTAADADQVRLSWEEIKRSEKQRQTTAHTLAEIPLAFPALVRAEKLQKKLDQLNQSEQSSGESLAAAAHCLQELQQGADGERYGELLWHIVDSARKNQVHLELELLDYIKKMIDKY